MSPATTAAGAVAGIASGDRVFIGSGAAEPVSLVEAMTDRAPELRDVNVLHIFTMGCAPYVEPQYEPSFRHTAFFVGPNVREAVQQGRADFVPVFLTEIPKLFATRYPLDWALVQLSPPDRHGYCTVGVSADLVVSAIRNARHVVAELNPRMPRTLGDTAVHVSRLDATVEVDRPVPELTPAAPSDVITAIGRNVAGLIADGDCLQIGIGGIPDAVLAQLGDRRHLGVHTEMLTDGVVALYEKGAIDGSRKTVEREKIVCSFAIGTALLYDFVDDNAVVAFHGNEFTNDPFVIAQNDDVVAVNSAIQVDLTGQVNADSFGVQVYSGIGGQVDFIRGASRSRGGRPVIALPSTAMADSVSRIVPTLAEGAGVVTSRGDVHYVVTEHGVADLYARGVHERARALIGVAHPDFRESLERTAYELGLLPAGPSR
jgi:4-hydroxybutyrate CoA-transferase